MRSRSRSRSAVHLAAALAALVTLTSCEGLVYVRADADRGQAESPLLERSTVLAASARARSAAMCAQGAATPSIDPNAAHDRETIAAAQELVGSAPLDPTIADRQERNNAATNEILASWTTPPWTDEHWDRIGVGEIECGDGRLYLTAVTTERPTMPTTGRYSSRQYPLDQVEEHLDLQYGTAVNHQGQSQDLLLDLYLPPSHGADRPLLILVHGGGFANGDKADMASAARDYARRGFATVSLGYRLNPTLPGYSDLEAYLAAAADAIDDGREAVRWLRANAVTYEINPDRIAMMGNSAGGGVALGVAFAEDDTPGGPLAHVSPRIQAAVAGGATLTLGLDAINFDDSDSPAMMIHYETDSATGATSADVTATCEAVWGGGGTCDRVILPGTGHGSPLGGSGPWWAPEIGPFFWEHLDLSTGQG